MVFESVFYCRLAGQQSQAGESKRFGSGDCRKRTSENRHKAIGSKVEGPRDHNWSSQKSKLASVVISLFTTTFTLRHIIQKCSLGPAAALSLVKLLKHAFRHDAAHGVG